MSFRLLSKKGFHLVHKSIEVTLVWRLFMEKWVTSMDTPYTNAHYIKSIPNTDPHIPCAQNRNPLLEFWEYHPSKLNAIPWKSESNFWKGRQVKTLRPHPCIVCHHQHHQYFYSNHDIHCWIFIRTRRIDLKRSVLLNRFRSTFSIIASSSLARSFLSKLIIILSIFFVTQTSQFLTLNFFSPFGQIFPNLQSNWFSGENTFCN